MFFTEKKKLFFERKSNIFAIAQKIPIFLLFVFGQNKTRNKV